MNTPSTDGHSASSRVEARIKVSGTQGLWPAFWLLGSNFFQTKTPWPTAVRSTSWNTSAAT